MKRTAFVTGSSRGIGKAIALRLAKDGYKVILHASKMSGALLTAEKELKKTGAFVMTVCFDVSRGSEITLGCDSILKYVGHVDILVNNAGISQDKTVIKMSEEDWNNVIKTNLYGPFSVTQKLLPYMVKRKFGRIINISSIASRGAFGKANYAASKAGVIGFTKSLALEIGKYNITANTVCPGYIDTSLSKSIPVGYRKQFLSQIALGRIGKPEEVAHLVAFLAGPDSSYITGAVIDINGGWI